MENIKKEGIHPNMTGIVGESEIVSFIISKKDCFEDKLMIYHQFRMRFLKRKKLPFKSEYKYDFYTDDSTQTSLRHLQIFEQTVLTMQKKYNISFERQETTTDPREYDDGALTVFYVAIITQDDINKVLYIKKQEKEQRCNVRLESLRKNNKYMIKSDDLLQSEPLKEVAKIFETQLNYKCSNIQAGQKIGFHIQLNKIGIGVDRYGIDTEYPDGIVFFRNYGYKNLNPDNEEMDIMLLAVYKCISNSLDKFIQLSPNIKFYNVKILIPTDQYEMDISFTINDEDNKELTSLF